MSTQLPAHTQVQILDGGLNLLTTIQSFYPLSSGAILKYSTELSEFGTCTFRLSSYDPIFTTLGDIINPHQYHIRVVRDNVIVWNGAIVENTTRTKDFIEVVAAEYLFYLNKILVQRTSPDVNGDTNIYRLFQSGTMAAAVTAIMNETITSFKGVTGTHPLANLTLGEIDNPNFPPNTSDQNGNPLTGGWVFADTDTGQGGVESQYDFNTIFYVLQAMGSYTFADFQITEDLVFNFESFLGNDHHLDINLSWGDGGNATDFNIPRLGQRMANQITGIATTPDGVIYQTTQSDQASITTYGLVEGVAAYSGIEDQNTLNARVAAELPLINTPDDTALSITTSGGSAPTIGTYAVGDLINVSINHIAVQFNDVRRVVGITVSVHDTGRETVVTQTNKPLPWQYPSVTGAGVDQ